MNSSTHGGVTPVTLNLHITERCNYRCGFCYGVFADTPGALACGHWLDLIRMVADSPPLFGRYPIDKITFAGGEPTLVLFLPELLACVKESGLVSSLVTNGTRLDDAYLRVIAPLVDWIAVSIESGNEATNVALGRGFGNHVRQTVAAVARLRRYPHLRIKVNTVVTALNWKEDLHDLIRVLRPDRWKVLQATRIVDQNGAGFDRYAVTNEQFKDFCDRHADLGPVCEGDTDIKGSYLMVDPAGRCFGNATGRHVYSDSVLRVGLKSAVRQVGWSPDAFIPRGGAYDWR